jgi:hypothetical protein
MLAETRDFSLGRSVWLHLSTQDLYVVYELCSSLRASLGFSEYHRKRGRNLVSNKTAAWPVLLPLLRQQPSIHCRLVTAEGAASELNCGVCGGFSKHKS